MLNNCFWCLVLIFATKNSGKVVLVHNDEMEVAGIILLKGRKSKCKF